jgi:hypothetical protein
LICFLRWDPTHHTPWDPTNHTPWDPTHHTPWDPTNHTPWDPTNHTPWDPTQVRWFAFSDGRMSRGAMLWGFVQTVVLCILLICAISLRHDPNTMPLCKSLQHGATADTGHALPTAFVHSFSLWRVPLRMRHALPTASLCPLLTVACPLWVPVGAADMAWATRRTSSRQSTMRSSPSILCPPSTICAPFSSATSAHTVPPPSPTSLSHCIQWPAVPTECPLTVWHAVTSLPLQSVPTECPLTVWHAVHWHCRSSSYQ